MKIVGQSKTERFIAKYCPEFLKRFGRFTIKIIISNAFQISLRIQIMKSIISKHIMSSSEF